MRVRHFRRIACIALCLGGLAGTGQAATPPAPGVLRFAVSESWTAPYIEMHAGRPVGGLMFDLTEAIARGAGLPARYVVLPSKRMDAAIEGGQIDLHCLMSPTWFDTPLPAHRFGPPMVVLEDVLAAPEGDPVVDLNVQQGLRVGTVLGYRYGELEPLFAAGRLAREDAPNQQRMLDKLDRGRSSVAVVDRLVLVHYNRGQPASRQLVAQQTVSRIGTHCLLGTRLPVPAARLIGVLQTMVDSGELKRLLDRYR